VEYLAYRTAVGLLRVAPESLALRAGEAVGWMVGVVFRIRWNTVMDHLRLAFPDRDPAWRRSVAKASFRHLGRESVATFRMSRLDAAGVRERLEMVGFEAFDEAVAEGKGVVVLTGHFGNWEMAGASVVARGVPMDVIAQRQRNPLFDVDITRNRERLGMTVVERREALRTCLRTLRNGGVVGIVGDQNLRRGGVFVEFFGRPAATAKGAALFAVRTGAPLFVGAAKRVPGFPQRYKATVRRIEFEPTGDLEKDVLRLTKAHTRYLEETVREAPEQYFWQHRRWKTQPSGEADATR
jgi:KDO2-lipid IV(A) lauroyltransferase